MIDMTRAKLITLYDLADLPKRIGRIQAAGGKVVALVIQTTEFPDEPLCPECHHGIEDDLPKMGAGLIVCPYCGQLQVVLRLLSGPSGTIWHSFPWPE